MLRFEGREESHRGSTPWVSAKDKSFHPFPALPAYVLADHPPEIGYEWALTAAAAHLLDKCYLDYFLWTLCHCLTELHFNIWDT